MEKYKATAVRSGDMWAVTVHDVPVKGAAVTQGHDKAEAENMTVEMLSLLLEHRDFSVDITFAEELRG